jgi:hypothetical protein
MSPETREDVDFSDIENSLKRRKRIFILREKMADCTVLKKTKMSIKSRFTKSKKYFLDVDLLEYQACREKFDDAKKKYFLHVDLLESQACREKFDDAKVKAEKYFLNVDRKTVDLLESQACREKFDDARKDCLKIQTRNFEKIDCETNEGNKVDPTLKLVYLRSCMKKDAKLIEPLWKALVKNAMECFCTFKQMDFEVNCLTEAALMHLMIDDLAGNYQSDLESSLNVSKLSKRIRFSELKKRSSCLESTAKTKKCDSKK